MAGNSDSERKNGIGRPFPKGVSGNPSGRPKLIVEFQKALLEKHYQKAIDALDKCLDDEDGRVRMAAIREVFDRLLGKVTQPVSGPDGAPLVSVDLASALQRLVK